MKNKWAAHSTLFIFCAVFLVGIVCLPLSASAQGCASCYTTTATGGSQTIRALRSGILLLFVPPVLVFSAILIATTRWKQQSSMPESKRRS
jgi:hypothetical protein